VFGPGNRVEISHTARLFTGATRRAIELRDGSAPTPTVTGHDPPRWTTSSPMPTVVPPPRKMGAFSADFTIDCGTKRPPPSG